MNPSELNNAIGVAVTVGGPIVARWGIDAGHWSAIVTSIAPAIPAIGGGLWLIYSHWNMKKVPETSVALPPAK